MNHYDVVIVGCGICGSTIARVLAEKNKKVVILERRDHIGGNMYDEKDAHGVWIHRYGPHTFHTSDNQLMDFITKYSQWYEYHLTCGAVMNGICVPTPFNFSTIDAFYSPVRADELKKALLCAYPNRKTVPITELMKTNDPLIREYALFLFQNDFSLYTSKQWGISPEQVDPSVLERVPVRLNYDIGYFEDQYQVMPTEGYTVFFQSLLNHPNIDVILYEDALQRLSIDGKHMLVDGDLFQGSVVYTGALDELFHFQFGKLPYRSLRFEWKYEGINNKQEYPVVAYPQAEGFTRIVEYNKLPVQNTVGTSYAVEYPLPYFPGKQMEPYYPVITKESQQQYSIYAQLADQVERLYICGRLADFKYYNMDQALKRALSVADVIE